MAPRHGCRRHTSRNRVADSPVKTPGSILTDARKLKQQAERKGEGAAREPLLKHSAELLRHGLTLSFSAIDQQEAWFDLGEVLLLWAQSVQYGLPALTGGPFTGAEKSTALEEQRRAIVFAVNLSRESHEAFENAWSPGERCVFKQEGIVNSGHALCEWAKLVAEIPLDQGGGVHVAAEICSRAKDRYFAAHLQCPDDVEVLTSLGDCFIQWAELSALDSPSEWLDVKDLYKQGLRAYLTACANSDARAGDDLASILHNWGVGLLSLAEHSGDLEEALGLVQAAKEKLQSALKFCPTDVSFHVTLGKGLTSFAELHLQDLRCLQQTLELLGTAIEDGFGVALKIDSSSVDALLGLGDAHLAAAKLISNSGITENAEAHFVESYLRYASGVRFLKEDNEGKYDLRFEEQCDALYNLACAAALAGHEMEARQALEQLADVGALSVKDLVDDPDFQILRMREWFMLMASS